MTQDDRLSIFSFPPWAASNSYFSRGGCRKFGFPLRVLQKIPEKSSIIAVYRTSWYTAFCDFCPQKKGDFFYGCRLHHPQPHAHHLPVRGHRPPPGEGPGPGAGAGDRRGSPPPAYGGLLWHHLYGQLRHCRPPPPVAADGGAGAEPSRSLALPDQPAGSSGPPGSSVLSHLLEKEAT